MLLLVFSKKENVLFLPEKYKIRQIMNIINKVNGLLNSNSFIKLESNPANTFRKVVQEVTLMLFNSKF